MQPNAALKPAVWSCLSPACDKNPCEPSGNVSLALILLKWNRFSPFITLPVFKTYLRLRSVGGKRIPSLSSLDTFKIHKSRGLGFLSAILHNNENSNILCKNSWQGIFFPLHSCSISPYKYTCHLTRGEMGMFILDGHKFQLITSHAHPKDGAEVVSSHLYSSSKLFQYEFPFCCFFRWNNFFFFLYLLF